MTRTKSAIILALFPPVICLVLTVARVPSAIAQTENAVKDGFSAYDLILERNIFNPERRPRTQDFMSKPAEQPRIDRISLVGVFMDQKRQVALFAGTQESYNMHLKLGDMIAGYKITEIRTDAVAIKKEDKQIEVRVGAGFQREGGGPWTFSTESPPPAASPASTSSSSGASSATDQERAAKLKELMERAKKERSK